MYLIKIFTNDKVIFLVNFILLILANQYVIQIDINSYSGLLLFVFSLGGLSYFISMFITIIILLCIYLMLKNRMTLNYNSLSISEKFFLIANTLEVYEDKINSVNDLIFYIYENRLSNFY